MEYLPVYEYLYDGDDSVHTRDVVRCVGGLGFRVLLCVVRLGWHLFLLFLMPLEIREVGGVKCKVLWGSCGATKFNTVSDVVAIHNGIEVLICLLIVYKSDIDVEV